MASQVEQAIAFARSKIGSSGYSGYCQKFVADCYVFGCGYPRIGTGTALNARAMWRVSTDRNIPTGACVYFDSPTSPKAGHVGLYIGGNQVIHAFGKVKLMTVDAIVKCGYRYQGWGWYAGKKPSGAGSTPVSSGSGSGNSGGVSSGNSSGVSTAPPVVHKPQTEKVYTAYNNDTPGKGVDAYLIEWRSDDGEIDISNRVGSLELEDDVDSICRKLTFSVIQSYNEKYLEPLKIRPGDMIVVHNYGAPPRGEVEQVFYGQVQSMSGSFRDSMQYTCYDEGRLLTMNDIVLQFNNCPAKEALSNIANAVGLGHMDCPELVSSVYDIVKDNAASIAQKILETITSENGVRYFLRVEYDTLLVRSFGEKPIAGYFRQAENLPAFDVFANASQPNGNWSIEDLRNHVVIYSEADNAVTVYGEATSEDSVKRYGRRTMLATYTDSDGRSAEATALQVLAANNKVDEEFSLHCYGSDKIVAGCRVSVALAEAAGDFHVVRVTHHLDTPHTMDLTLRRATE